MCNENEKGFKIPFAFTDTRALTLERNLMNTYNVGKPSTPNFPLFYITELIERNKSYEYFTNTSKDIYLKNMIRFQFHERQDKYIPPLLAH